MLTYIAELSNIVELFFFFFEFHHCILALTEFQLLTLNMNIHLPLFWRLV